MASMTPHINTLYIVGPTASGKSALALDIARARGAEIICADSQTVRREMNIGTAKPTPADQSLVPHHMLDIIDPYDNYSLHRFQKQAKQIIYDIHEANKLAIVVGGTGLYVDSLYFDYKLPELSGELSHSDYERLSVSELQAEIKQSGLALPENDKNPRHLINVLLRRGESGASSAGDKNALIVGISPPRELLIERINTRVDQMFDHGFVDEVLTIVSTYGDPPTEFDAIGYRIAMRHLKGEISIDEAKDLFKIADRQYAKRQISWLRRNKDIRWFDSPEQAKAFILETL
jgi:tRNA dimethylallyltransferase